MTVGSLRSPRPLPATKLPLAAGALVIALTFPIVLVAGWRLAAWALAAALWLASQAFALLLGLLRPRAGNLAAAGVLGVGMMLRAVAVMVTLFAVATSDGTLALAAALVYGLAYSAELAFSLVAYAEGPAA